MITQQAQPVTVTVAQANGKVDRILVGEAVQGPKGMELRLHSLEVGLQPTRAGAEAPSVNPATANRPSLRGTSEVNQTLDDLQQMADRARRALADPRKQRWHDDERTLLAEIEAEIARMRGP